MKKRVTTQRGAIDMAVMKQMRTNSKETGGVGKSKISAAAFSSSSSSSAASYLSTTTTAAAAAAAAAAVFLPPSEGGDGDEWSEIEMQELRRSHVSVPPTQPNFWDAIALRVPTKTSKQCHDMWVSQPPPPLAVAVGEAKGGIADGGVSSMRSMHVSDSVIDVSSSAAAATSSTVAITTVAVEKKVKRLTKRQIALLHATAAPTDDVFAAEHASSGPGAGVDNLTGLNATAVDNAATSATTAAAVSASSAAIARRRRKRECRTSAIRSMSSSTAAASAAAEADPSKTTTGSTNGFEEYAGDVFEPTRPLPDRGRTPTTAPASAVGRPNQKQLQAMKRRMRVLSVTADPSVVETPSCLSSAKCPGAVIVGPRKETVVPKNWRQARIGPTSEEALGFEAQVPIGPPIGGDVTDDEAF